MNFDLAKTIALIKGGLMNHQETWTDYLAENRSWQDTAALLTGPLLIANVVLGLIFSRLIGGYTTYGVGQNFFVALIMTLLLTIIGFFIAVFVFNFLAGVFGGKPDFSRAFAAVSLAAIPAWLAGIIAGLVPGIGFLIALAGGITSLVFTYKIMPQAVGVPDSKRVLHFIVSIITILVINMIISFIFIGDSIDRSFEDAGIPVSQSGRGNSGSGMLGNMERQGRLMADAMDDQYDPPSDGKLSRDQVRTYADMMSKTRDLQAENMKEVQKISADFEDREDDQEIPSASDLAKLYEGMGAVMNTNNAEMELVKTADGNWAEHQWIKQQLRVAQIQQGQGSDANEHNYELYLEFKDTLDGEG